MTAESRPRRSFWIHQLVEYLLGLGLVASGVQSTTPVIPAAAGVLLILNAAFVEGPFGAFRVVPRPLHRLLDLVIVAVIVVLAVMPFLNIDNTSRLVMIGVAFVHAVLSWQTGYERPRAHSGGRLADRANSVAGTAGRGAAAIVRGVRARQAAAERGRASASTAEREADTTAGGQSGRQP